MSSNISAQKKRRRNIILLAIAIVVANILFFTIESVLFKMLFNGLTITVNVIMIINIIKYIKLKRDYKEMQQNQNQQ